MAIFSPAAYISRRRCRVTGFRLLMPLLLPNPAHGAGVQEVERQDAAAQHLVVELADVEFCAQFFFGAGAKFAELELAELIREGLRRPGDVAIRFGLDGGFVDGAGLAE